MARNTRVKRTRVASRAPSTEPPAKKLHADEDRDEYEYDGFVVPDDPLDDPASDDDDTGGPASSQGDVDMSNPGSSPLTSVESPDDGEDDMADPDDDDPPSQNVCDGGEAETGESGEGGMSQGGDGEDATGGEDGVGEGSTGAGDTAEGGTGADDTGDGDGSRVGNNGGSGESESASNENGVGAGSTAKNEAKAGAAKAGAGSGKPTRRPVKELLDFARPDGVELALNAQRRFVKIAAFRNPRQAVFYITQLPSRLDWSSGRVKESRAVLPGEVTPVTGMLFGQISWNGMIANSRTWPTKPKVSIKTLREADLMRARQLIQDLSCSAKTIDTSNIGAVSAHADVGYRARGADHILAAPFAKLYDGQKKYSLDKNGMSTLRPADFVHGDIVLMEFTIGRYWDETKDGRVLNWNSNRVYFHLEAVTLLVQKAEDGAKAEENKLAAAGYSSMEQYF
ncbi:hypothetical protein PENSPDRAFT_691101 [Peniophora sp. CONT]|nr:hypothetical protein PENSPDRAFT_691101 [Peniophora sp. CONT]